MYPFFFFHSSKERPTAGCPKVGACNKPALYNICSNNIYITYPLEQSARSLEGPISVLFCVHLPESHSHGSEKRKRKSKTYLQSTSKRPSQGTCVHKLLLFCRGVGAHTCFWQRQLVTNVDVKHSFPCHLMKYFINAVFSAASVKTIQCHWT